MDEKKENFMSFGDLSGQVALITGGSRGIGRATAELLKAHGADVIVHGSSAETVEKAVSEMGVRGIVANLLEEGCIEKLAGEAGHVDILVNNAGITRDTLFIRQTKQQFDDVMLVNVNRVVELTHKVLPGMLSKGHGRIVNMTSVVAHMGNIGQTNYIAAKSALTGFTKALAKETARKGVTVNAIAPGFINTDMTAGIPENLKEAFVKQIPAQRFGDASDIANAVLYLVSKEAGYVTGTTLHVNGGMYV